MESRAVNETPPLQGSPEMHRSPLVPDAAASEPLFDVIIVHIPSMTVSSIVAYSVHEKGWNVGSGGRESAQETLHGLNHNLYPQYVGVIVPAGEVNKGSVLTALPEERARRTLSPATAPAARPFERGGGRPRAVSEDALPRARALTTRQRRQADVVCINCESPDLVTKLHCAACARLSTERSGASRQGGHFGSGQ